jgi:hypothetical protein
LISHLAALRHQVLPFLEIARLACFTTFVILAIRCSRSTPSNERKRVVHLIAFAATVAIAVGVTQVEAWPFTNWALVHTVRSPELRSWELEAVDSTGRAWIVDPRVLQPVSPEEFGSWMFREMDGLSAPERDELLRFVLERSEQGRLAFLAGHFPPNDRLLGEASAPFHFRQRRLWQRPADVPTTPFVTLRIRESEWNIDALDRDGSSMTRRVIAEIGR